MMKIQGINQPDDQINILFQELMESLDDIFFVLDFNWKVLFWNTKVAEITNIQKTDILHKSIYDFFPGIIGDALDETLKKAMATKQPHNCEQNYTLFGKEHIFQTRVVPCSIGLYAFGKDITEHRQELKKQKRIGEFFQTVIDNIPIFLTKLDKRNAVSWVNIPFQHVLGYTSNELKERKNLGTIFEDPNEYSGLFNLIDAKPNEWRDFQIKTREGKSMTTSWHFVTLSDGSKIGIGQDVTEKRKQLEELTHLHQHINAIINNLPIVLLSTDFEGRYKSIMGMGLEKLDLKPEELIGKSAYQIYGNLSFDNEVGSENINNVKEALNQVLMDKMVSGTIHLNEKDFNLKMVAEKDSNKNITGILGAALDITDKQEAEKRLRDANQLLEKTLDSLKEVVFVVGTEEKRGIVLCNRAVKETFGYTPEELIGKSTRLLHVDDKHYQEFGKKSETKVENKGYFHGEYQMKRKDGKIINTEHTIVPLDEKEGWQKGVVSIIRDISDRKNYIRQIKRYSTRLKQLTTHLQRIQEEERTKIAREIHDELGQIFSILKFNLSSLINELKSNQEQLQANHIRNELEAMKSITNDAIQTTRRFISELRPVAIDHMDVAESLNWLISDFQSNNGIKTQFINKTSQNITEEKIKVNYFRILQEALTNIQRHSEATKVTVSIQHKNEELIMIIKDNGKGISEKEKHKMNSYGILGMHERVNALNGFFNIRGIHQVGTVIQISIPFKNSEND